MYRFFFFLFFLSTAVAAPEIQQYIVEQLKPKLNSDRIEYFFGSYGVDPLEMDSIFRVANLYSLENGKKVMRTLAVVDYFQPVDPALLDVHQQIVEGKSIGIALRDKGWKIHKNPVYYGSIALSTNLMEWMDEHETRQGATHFYRLEVSKDDLATIPYCTILEVHSPQYLSLKWLQALNEEQCSTIFTKEASDLMSRLVLLVQEFPSMYNNSWK